MTQELDIINQIRKYSVLSNADLFNILNIPKASIRRLTGVLTKSGILNRVSRGTYELTKEAKTAFTKDEIKQIKKSYIKQEFVFRHLISAGFYANGKLEQLYAVTFKNDDVEIFNKLVKELIIGAEDSNHGSIPMVSKGKKAVTSNDFNYAIDKVPIEEINIMAKYPTIETGLD